MNKALGVGCIVLFLLCSCSSPRSDPPFPLPKIGRHPVPLNFNRGVLEELPSYDPEAYFFQPPDLRSYDLSDFDLSNRLSYLMLTEFDDRTIWPENDKMPAEFDLQQILEYGKNPGLGIQELHKSGITGEGVGIAIIDQKLLVDHQEYADQLLLYEELDDIIGGCSSMHGAAVASIAVGKTTGVAPKADLYFIAMDRFHDGTYIAKGINRILEINQQLPKNRKIRVISIQRGWQVDDLGYEELLAAIERAMSEGILVISSSLEAYTPFKFHGLGRSPLDDPDDFQVYLPGHWWAERHYHEEQITDRLLIPMDARATASPTGVDEYVYYSKGGWSWAMPYLAGVYALAVQADPSITPEQFWDIAMQTGRQITIEHEGESVVLGPIIDPQAIINELTTK